MSWRPPSVGTTRRPCASRSPSSAWATAPAWINNQQDWPDVYGLPLDNLFGVFGTTWYYKLDLPGVDDFVERYQARYPDTRMRVPGNVFYNGYMATRELLRAIERAGHHQQHRRSSNSSKGTRCRLSSACSTTTRGSIRIPIRSSRPSTWQPPMRGGSDRGRHVQNAQLSRITGRREATPGAAVGLPTGIVRGYSNVSTPEISAGRSTTTAVGLGPALGSRPRPHQPPEIKSWNPCTFLLRT